MTKMLRKEQCPKCAAEGKDKHKDNLAVYEDGMKYCFARHKVVEAPVRTSLDMMWRMARDSEFNKSNYEGAEIPAVATSNRKPQKESSNLDTSEGGKNHINFSAQIPKLPDDFTTVLPKKGYEYLVGFNFSAADITIMGVGWSDQYQRLVFPIIIDEHMKAWQGRYLGDQQGRAKWWTEGNIITLNPVLPGRPTSDVLVVTEDILSAYKVGKYHNAMPLFGTTFPKSKMVRLAKDYKKIVLWLDHDMAKRMNELRAQCTLYFESSGLICTTKDPKSVSYKEIDEKLERWEDAA